MSDQKEQPPLNVEQIEYIVRILRRPVPEWSAYVPGASIAMLFEMEATERAKETPK